jgi:hypothetical protein
MTGADKVVCQAATLLVLFALTTAPAKAQFGGFGGAGGGADMMTQMAPMLNMMKAKMGKRRFGMLMQTMGPMMANMMQNGGFGGMSGGFGGMPGGFGGASPSGFGGAPYPADSPPVSAGPVGGDIMGMIGGGNGADMMAMIPQLMQLANLGGGSGHRRHRRRD